MPERAPDRPPSTPRADPTRDVRRPPLSRRAVPAVPPQADGPTEHLTSPSHHPLRQRTQALPPRLPVPVPQVTGRRRRRRTTTVLWTLVLLTLAVIVFCGVYLVIVVTQR